MRAFADEARKALKRQAGHTVRSHLRAPRGFGRSGSAGIRPTLLPDEIKISARRFDRLVFPDGFKWGVAVAGAQTEGHDVSSNWARFLARKHGKGHVARAEAVDFWHRFTEDIARAEKSGANLFRFSVEWGRIEPRPGVIDRAALARYVKMVDRINKSGMEPLVTLHHFSHPGWLDETAGGWQVGKARLGGRSGWERADMPDRFAAFTETVATALKGKVKRWITINEPNVEPIAGYGVGFFPPGKKNPLAVGRVVENITRAHVKAYDVLHRIDPTAEVSSNVFRMEMDIRGKLQAAPGLIDPAHRMLQRWTRWQDRPGGPVRNTLDFLSFDYYYALKPTELSKAMPAYNWPVRPEGLYQALKEYHQKFGLPLLIAENGLASYRGGPRPDGWTREAYLVNHLVQVKRAIDDGVPVKGYTHWTLTDNYEWGSFDPTFGLYAIDRAGGALKRRATPALEIFKRITGSNSLPADLLARYAGRRS
ncbi:MAG: glycoside hydrolase family 1 protein [Candidatus Sericytochromatia bacterium]|nr:glycoside hydrolase family 1 protein [Candidatus Tanganyikabacteria bacterium]